jgi:ABC-type uncharacterized transport system substrate-binding protein
MVAACAIFSSALVAGDYTHVLDVVKQNWPDRTMGIAICSLEANQFALLDLVDTAKERGMSLVIMNLKTAKEAEQTIHAALNRHPGFFLIIDEDPLMGTKGRDLSTLTGRAMTYQIPTVGLSAEAIKHGATLAAGANPTDKVFYSGKLVKKLELTTPEGGVDVDVK